MPLPVLDDGQGPDSSLRVLFFVGIGFVHGTLKQGAEITGRLFLGTEIGVDFGLLFLVSQLLDGQGDLALVGIHVENHRLEFVTLFGDILRAVDLLFADLGDVDQAFDPLLDLEEDAEIGHRGHLTADDGALRIAVRDRLPRIGVELLDAE